MKRAADHIVETLVNLGVNTFFGVPGGPVSPIFDAIVSNPKARLIESRQETGAVFEAVGYHRACGEVPCVVVTSGPGITNSLTGVASAHFERVPMVLISGDVSWEANGGCLLQTSGPEGLDIENMFNSVTRAQLRVMQAQAAPSYTMDAYRAATAHDNPGPALLVVPIHRASAEAQVPQVIHATGARTSKCIPERLLTEVSMRLAKSSWPLLVIGAGARPFKDQISRLVDRLRIPFVTTPRAKGLLSEEHPMSLRNGGLAASYWAREYTKRGVDFALVLGTDLDDCSVGPTPYIKEDGYLVHVDLNARVFNRNLHTTVGIVADLGDFLYTFGGLRHAVHTEVWKFKESSPFEVPNFKNDLSPQITPYRAIADLEAAAPQGTTFVTDIGEHMLFSLHYLTSDSNFMVNLGLGSMGSGICSAIGHALGDPEKTVICICGDGGMQMNGMEVLTALHHKLKVVFAVFNDGRYNMVHHGFKQVFGKDLPWGASQVNFFEWGHALGLGAEVINEPGDITPRLIQDLTLNGPAILDIRIDPSFRVAGGGRNESLQHMSMAEQSDKDN